MNVGHVVTVAVITDQQRAQLVELFREDPYRPHIATLRQIGVPGTKGELRKLLKTDEQIATALEQARYDYLKEKRLGVDKMLGALVEIVEDTDNPSRLRALTLGLTLNGVVTADRQRVEVTGEDGDPVEVTNPDLNAAVDRFTNTIRQLADRSAAEPGGDVRQLGPGPAADTAGPAGG